MVSSCPLEAHSLMVKDACNNNSDFCEEGSLIRVNSITVSTLEEGWALEAQ